ncbi:hypothetical protein SPRG_09964 [Saprolegnia parasitica CBS 223.65]|uniref:Uncharacterized protein n=1 Tax=Saprolegnia parasitica (strain CBS 223.65) TaxID=695850 RepID=A0A067C9F0_SAPPC|nr:hypothetical protein SPRG_09964 [Saprolegnia parasitica CBS 223.65]KDO23156.1 hypothetical protein SPRG_09964 [Saprolegnia parasitica CBS 223.65]|eukprot:XP_012206108.1 hypothetical protein SPRG_09964 [Saprolegnia parasitica CBS 223.65]
MRTLAMTLAAVVASTAAVTSPPLVQWFAPFMSGGGYCSEAISFVEALAALASPAYTLQITQHGDSFNNDFAAHLPVATRDTLEAHWFNPYWSPAPPRIAVCHSEPGAWHPARYHTSTCPPIGSAYAIGRTMFETDRIPSGWADRMAAMDEIWVPTQFQKQVFQDGGVPEAKLVVVPEAVDVTYFDPEKATPLALPGVDASTIVFLSIFKWEERKGWKILLRSYLRAFPRDANVLLVLLTNAYHSSSDFEAMITEFALDDLQRDLDDLPRVHVLPPHLPQDELPSLYKAATAFVLPSRGEGWGRPHVEAMAMGLPVIATFWSGPTEFMTQDNSFPLQIDGLVPILDGAFKGHLWANPSETHLIELLQYVATHPEDAKAKGQRARADMVDKYAPSIVAEIVDAHWQRILASLPIDEPHEEL